MTRSAEACVHATIVGHPEGVDLARNALAVLRSEVRVLIVQLQGLLVDEVLFFAESARLNARGRNTLFDQIALDTGSTALGQRNTVRGGAALVGVPFEDQVSFRSKLEILLEIGEQVIQAMLLAGNQATLRISFAGPVIVEVYAVERESGFEDGFAYGRLHDMDRTHNIPVDEGELQGGVAGNY